MLVLTASAISVDGLRFLLAEEVAAGSRPIGGLLDQFLSVNTIRPP
jgi:hypothetical protein